MKQYQAQFWKLILLLKEEYFPRSAVGGAGFKHSLSLSHIAASSWTLAGSHNSLPPVSLPSSPESKRWPTLDRWAQSSDSSSFWRYVAALSLWKKYLLKTTSIKHYDTFLWDSTKLCLSCADFAAKTTDQSAQRPAEHQLLEVMKMGRRRPMLLHRICRDAKLCRGKLITNWGCITTTTVFFFYICIMFYLRLTYLKISAVPQWSVAAKLFFIFSWLELRWSGFFSRPLLYRWLFL